jgi:hypothetical protein
MSERLFFNNIREAWRILRHKPAPDVSTGVQIVTGDPTQDAFNRVAELESEVREYREAIDSIVFLAASHPHLWNPKMQRAYFLATRKS